MKFEKRNSSRKTYLIILSARSSKQFASGRASHITYIITHTKEFDTQRGIILLDYAPRMKKEATTSKKQPSE